LDLDLGEAPRGKREAQRRPVLVLAALALVGFLDFFSSGRIPNSQDQGSKDKR